MVETASLTLVVATLSVATLEVATLAVATLAVATLAVATLAVATLAVATLAVGKLVVRVVGAAVWVVSSSGSSEETSATVLPSKVLALRSDNVVVKSSALIPAAKK